MISSGKLFSIIIIIWNFMLCVVKIIEFFLNNLHSLVFHNVKTEVYKLGNIF